MATIEVPLIHGIETKGENGKNRVHKDAVLRELTAGDLIDAAAESERVVELANGDARLVSSPAMEGINILRRQVVKLGDLQGPLTLSELRRLAPEDLDLLQQKAEQLDRATLEASKQRGRNESDRRDG